MGKTGMINYIIKAADKVLQRQNKNGNFHSGHNGTYIDPETSSARIYEAVRFEEQYTF